MLKKYSVNPTLNMVTGQWTSEGEVWIDDANEMKFDRALAGSAEKQADTAGSVASQDRATANGLNAQVSPFYHSLMNETHAFNPTQMNELLTASAAPLSSSLGDAEGEARSEMERTHNTAGFSSALDDAARQRDKTMAGASEKIGAEDVLGAKQDNAAGAAGLTHQADQDTSAMLSAMGIQNEDTNTALKANQQGWYQKMLEGINTGANVMKGMGLGFGSGQTNPFNMGGGPQ